MDLGGKPTHRRIERERGCLTPIVSIGDQCPKGSPVPLPVRERIIERPDAVFSLVTRVVLATTGLTCGDREFSSPIQRRASNSSWKTSEESHSRKQISGEFVLRKPLESSFCSLLQFAGGGVSVRTTAVSPARRYSWACRSSTDSGNIAGYRISSRDHGGTSPGRLRQSAPVQQICQSRGDCVQRHRVDTHACGSFLRGAPTHSCTGVSYGTPREPSHPSRR